MLQGLLTWKIVALLLRHILTALGASLVARGWVDAGQADTLVGAVMTLAGLGWSVKEKVDASAPTGSP